MTRRRSALPLPPIPALLGVSMAAFSATLPSATDLSRCAGIAAPDARLACYDTLAGRPADRTVTATPLVPAASTVPAAAVPAVSSPVGDPRNFGLSEAQLQKQAQPHAAPQAPTAIQAHIVKIIDNRIGRALLVLDNGQTWGFVDADFKDAQLNPGDPVTIKRASLGSFLMLTQSKHSYHVRRTQ